jgi:hypothetical protein
MDSHYVGFSPIAFIFTGKQARLTDTTGALIMTKVLWMKNLFLFYV